tara:strand:+ start:60 stop:314 length:255 start_codon:yes stop_codon:yes gene_type:complete
MRLMMIDDDPTFLTVFSKTLTQKGHQVLTFEKPCHAIKDIQGNPEKYDAGLSGFQDAGDVRPGMAGTVPGGWTPTPGRPRQRTN